MRQLGDIISSMERYIHEGTPFVGIADGSRGLKLAPGAAERRIGTDFITVYREKMRTTCLGFCTVSSSTVMRGIITAINWVAPLPMPNDVFATRQEAILWAKQQLAERASA